MRVGGTQSIEVDVRFIAATNRNIKEAIASGLFRSDLYYRLNVVALEIPSLKERRDDIPLLCQYFLMKHAKLMGKEAPSLSAEVLRILERYDYPGNVRELENIIERGMVLASGNTIEIRHLPHHLRHGEAPPTREKSADWETLAEHEVEYIRQVLEEADGNKSLAASILGIDRSSLWRKMKKYRLED